MNFLLARKPWFMAVLIFLFLSIAVLSFAQEKGLVPTGDLKELLTLMEDPQKRENFVRNLKQMIQIQEASQKEAPRSSDASEKAGKISFVASVFTRFEKISEHVLEAANRTFTWIFKLPESFGGAKSYLGKPENRNAQHKLINPRHFEPAILFIFQ